MDIEFVRIGEKLINVHKINDIVRKVLTLRAQGYSQSEVSKKLQIERTFISRVEGIGEVRRGGRIAVVGFPVDNKTELLDVCDRYGVEYTFLMTDEERWKWLTQNTGNELINNIMEKTSEIRNYELIVVLGSNYRINLIKALLNKEIIGIEIGKSPIEGDVYVNPSKLEQVISDLV